MFQQSCLHEVFEHMVEVFYKFICLRVVLWRVTEVNGSILQVLVEFLGAELEGHCCTQLRRGSPPEKKTNSIMFVTVCIDSSLQNCTSGHLEK